MGDIQLKPGFENMNMPPEEIKAEAVEAVSQMGLGEYNVQGGGYFARAVDGIPVVCTYNDGLRTFKWINPYTIEGLSEEYVFLLPFSDISNIFEEMILKKHADNFNNEGDTVDIQVDKVVLSYMRVREKDSMEGTLIPVWDFFGTKTYRNAAGEVELVADRVYDGVLPESMLTINAMDGTIVDRWAGY